LPIQGRGEGKKRSGKCIPSEPSSNIRMRSRSKRGKKERDTGLAILTRREGERPKRKKEIDEGKKTGNNAGLETRAT